MKWIKRLYDNAYSCVKINGITTDTFKLERSVRQGCPLSALLYSLSAEPLAALLSTNNNITGIELPSGKKSLIYQYADDTTITVKNRESSLETMKMLQIYENISGAKINVNKSEIMYVGIKDEDKIDIGLNEKGDYFKILGVNLGKESKNGRDKVYEGLLNELKRKLNFWKLRGLKLRGKVIVVNNLIMSKVVYIIAVLDVPDKIIKSINDMISDFLWDGKGVRIAKEVMENDYTDGGLKLINLEKKKDALRIKTMIKYLQNKDDHIWKTFLSEAINNSGKSGNSGIYMKMRKEMLKNIPDFHREVLEAWGKFIETANVECSNVEQIWEQPIFLNPKIKCKNTTVFNNAVWDAGFRRIKDIVYEFTTGFLSSQVFIDEISERGKEMRASTAKEIMMKIKEGMPKEWRELIEKDERRGMSGKVEINVGNKSAQMNVLNMKTKNVYKCLSCQTIRRPTAEKVWHKLRPKLDVNIIWKNLSVKYNSVECESFDFLFRHNRIFNNLIISRFDKNVSSICDVCKQGVESFIHEFFECPELTVYFTKMKVLLSRCWDTDDFKEMEWMDLWMFGYHGKKRTWNVNLMNLVLSHARYAVKLRRNIAHFEEKVNDVWIIFKSILESDIKAIHKYLDTKDFEDVFMVGNSLIKITINGCLSFDFD